MYHIRVAILAIVVAAEPPVSTTTSHGTLPCGRPKKEKKETPLSLLATASSGLCWLAAAEHVSSRVELSRRAGTLHTERHDVSLSIRRRGACVYLF